MNRFLTSFLTKGTTPRSAASIASAGRLLPYTPTNLRGNSPWKTTQTTTTNTLRRNISTRTKKSSNTNIVFPKSNTSTARTTSPRSTIIQHLPDLHLSGVPPHHDQSSTSTRNVILKSGFDSTMEFWVIYSSIIVTWIIVSLSLGGIDNDIAKIKKELEGARKQSANGWFWAS